MIEDDQNHMCGNNSGGGDGSGGGGGGDGSVSRSSTTKKSKHNKVPQRGLGVAQLEKMRMKEQQKDGNSFSCPTPLSPTNSTSQYGIPLLNFTHTNNQRPLKSCVPYSPPSPPPMPVYSSSPYPAFGSCSSPNIVNFPLGSAPSLDPTNGYGIQAGWPTFPVHGNVSFPKMWHTNPHEISPTHEGENSIFPTNLSLRHETCNVTRMPVVLPRSTLHHNPPSSNSLENVMSSTSALNFPMEPPSNQNIYRNCAPPLPDDQEKMMVGMKRSCPIPTLSSKLSPIVTHPLNRSDEPTIGGNGCTSYDLDSISIFRETSCPSRMPVAPANSIKLNLLENGNSSKFLSLAPQPSITAPFSSSRIKKFRKFDTAPLQISVESSLLDSRHGSSSQQTSLMSFFPPTELQAASVPSPAVHCNSDLGENIDLNLKL